MWGRITNRFILRHPFLDLVGDVLQYIGCNASLPSGLSMRPVRHRALRVRLFGANHSGFFEPSVVSAVHWSNPL